MLFIGAHGGRCSAGAVEALILGDSYADDIDMGFYAWPSKLAQLRSLACLNAARGGAESRHVEFQYKHAKQFRQPQLEVGRRYCVCGPRWWQRFTARPLARPSCGPCHIHRYYQRSSWPSWASHVRSRSCRASLLASRRVRHRAQTGRPRATPHREWAHPHPHLGLSGLLASSDGALRREPPPRCLDMARAAISSRI